ncbi:MAG: winged helix-turn-helix transcriptional regulator [Anaerolineales bacterium]|nr:winged helix-turn-helix transcriptional regulator [Anaerolineales bacterium]
MEPAHLHWDYGMAYDLFVSQIVLHNPAEHGVRGVWAAGVRARLPSPARQMLEQGLLVLTSLPFSWLYGLPEPKDSNTVLWALRQAPPAERLPLLALQPEFPPEYADILRNVHSRRVWDEDDRQTLGETYRKAFKYSEKRPPSHQELAAILGWWARPEEFGERYLEALSVYQEVFFSEEEKRIRPALKAALARAKERSEQLGLVDLLEELTQGVRFEILPDVDRVTLAPSYWCTPLLYFGKINEGHMIYLYGARPPQASVVPGETVPDALLQALKALSDSTRLQILQYLAEQPLTPTELSQRLRLRVPTVVHHLNTLRLAGLVVLTLGEEAVTKHYAARPEAVEAAFAVLQSFMRREIPDPTTAQSTLPDLPG